MRNKKGFTLMEILLAALIVGVIGIALAALTTAAVRESGVGRSHAVLRQQLSAALSQLRQDIAQSTEAGIDSDGTFWLRQEHALGPNHNLQTDIRYSFEAGTVAGVGGGTTGGQITRTAYDSSGNRQDEIWLGNVKSITSADGTFVSPQFAAVNPGSDEISAVLEVRIIVEVPTQPVVNETVIERFFLPQGVSIQPSGA